MCIVLVVSNFSATFFISFGEKLCHYGRNLMRRQVSDKNDD